jgi:hypothetical protein
MEHAILFMGKHGPILFSPEIYLRGTANNSVEFITP